MKNYFNFEQDRMWATRSDFELYYVFLKVKLEMKSNSNSFYKAVIETSDWYREREENGFAKLEHCGCSDIIEMIISYLLDWTDCPYSYRTLHDSLNKLFDKQRKQELFPLVTELEKRLE